MSDEERDGGEPVADVIEKQHTGASITAKLKRGTGMRDQDTITIKGKGKDAEEAIEQFEQCLEAAWDRQWAYRLRGFRADGCEEVTDDE